MGKPFKQTDHLSPKKPVTGWDQSDSRYSIVSHQTDHSSPLNTESELLSTVSGTVLTDKTWIISPDPCDSLHFQCLQLDMSPSVDVVHTQLQSDIGYVALNEHGFLEAARSKPEIPVGS